MMLSSRGFARLDNITAVQQQKTKIQMGNVEEEVVEGGRWAKNGRKGVVKSIRSVLDSVRFIINMRSF